MSPKSDLKVIIVEVQQVTAYTHTHCTIYGLTGTAAKFWLDFHPHIYIQCVQINKSRLILDRILVTIMSLMNLSSTLTGCI